MDLRTACRHDKIFEAAGVERAQRLCQRCEGSTVDDVEHTIIDCARLWSMLLSISHCLHVNQWFWQSFVQDLMKPAVFVHNCSMYAINSMRSENWELGLK